MPAARMVTYETKAIQNYKAKPWAGKGGTANGSEIHVRLRQQLRNRSLGRGAPGRAKLAAEGELRPLCRATLRFAVHRAAGHQSAHLALSDKADGPAHRPVSEGRGRLHPYRPGPGRNRSADWPVALVAD